MKKVWVAVAAVLLFTAFAAPLSAAEEPAVKADAALLYDMDAQTVLWQKAGDEPMAPASLIKVLNILTAMPYIDFEEETEIGPLTETVYSGQLLHLRSGDILTVGDLLYGMMLFSANDCAVALADHLLGSVPLYALLMDTKAWASGAVHTVSVNVNGYSDAAQKTTAKDLAVVGTAYMGQKPLKKIAGTYAYTVCWRKPQKQLEIRNINQLLGAYAGATGLKTGTTDMAGKCLMATAERDGRRLLAVALNSSDRYGDCMRLLDYGYPTKGVLAEIGSDTLE